MQTETKLEIRAVAVRLVPPLIKMAQVLAVLALVSAVINLVALVAAISKDDAGVNAVTESGQVFNVPTKKK